MLLGATNERKKYTYLIAEVFLLVQNFNQISAAFLLESKGSFTNYVDKILAFFDHLPPFVDSFYLIKVDIF